ncbi:MAG: hypothetical protein H0W78_07150 [Planctomycetes bacterium]|nr:hypothetical protein [Planctomycetota bacterium]
MTLIWYEYKELTSADFGLLEYVMRSEYGFHFTPDEISPQDINPSFDHVHGETTRFKLFELIDKHKNGLKKYCYGLYKKKGLFGKLDYKSKILSITVCRHKVNHDQKTPYECIDVYVGDDEPKWVHDMKGKLIGEIEQRLGLKRSAANDRYLYGLMLRNEIRHEPLLRITAGPFANSDYDDAISSAATLCEKEFRAHLSASGATLNPTDTGVDLSRIAYHDQSGFLSPPYPVASQANHGAFLMAQGFFLYIRNGFSHNHVAGISPKDAYHFLRLCDDFLFLILNSKKR